MEDVYFSRDSHAYTVGGIKVAARISEVGHPKFTFMQGNHMTATSRSAALACAVAVFMLYQGGARGEYISTEACSVRYIHGEVCMHLRAMIGVEG